MLVIAFAVLSLVDCTPGARPPLSPALSLSSGLLVAGDKPQRSVASELVLAVDTPKASRDDVRFVVASTTVVRAEPKDSARPVVEAGIGTPVVVVVTNGATQPAHSEWLRVLVGPRVLRFDSLDDEAVPIAPRVFDGRLPQGFVRASDVTAQGAAAPTRRALLNAAANERDDVKKRALWLRAWALDPHDPEVARVAAPTAKSITARRVRSPVERADLVFGCSGDLARATVVAGTVATFGGARSAPRDDVCIAGLDVRPPCEVAHQPQHKADMARLIPRYGNDGPALRLMLGPGAGEQAVYVVARTLVVDGCVDCVPSAATRDVKVTRLRVPRVEKGTALLHVVVPRAVGVAYDIVAAANREDVDDEPQSFELGDAFDADPRDREEAGPGAHLFAAPDVCSCTCEDNGDGDGDGLGKDEGDDVDDAP